MIRAVLTDFEGTLCPAAFLHDVLEPYAHERMEGFIRDHGERQEVRQLIRDVQRLAGSELSDTQAAQQLMRWDREGRPIAPLNLVRALIWMDAIERDDFAGEVYDDAVAAMRDWRGQGLGIYTFSVMPEQAQRLLFAHTAAGDLSGLVSGFFDTRVGAKDDPTAYQSIATSIGMSPSEVLMVSDSEEELDAARQVGMYTAWVVREGAVDLQAPHRQAARFGEIPLR